MKKLFLLLFYTTLYVFLSAQNISVEQLESKWRVLYQKGSVAFDNNDYINATKYFSESVNLLTNNEAKNTKYHIYSLIKLGETYHKSGEHEKELLVTNELIEIRKVIRPNSKREVDYLYNFGYYLSNLNRFDEALVYLNGALSLDEPLSQMQGEKSMIFHRIAFCHYCLNDYQQAIDYEVKSIEFDDNKTPDYQKSLAFYYYKSQNWEGLERIMHNCYDYTREPVLRKFSQSKALDRAIYWDKAKYLFTDFIPRYASEHPSDILVSYAYNAALFSKGILLSAENKTAELILNSNDSELIKQYNHYIDLKKKKNRSLDEEFEMQALSDVFIRYQKEHKNEYRQDFRIKWEDVQSKLTDNDIAIEFITVPNSSGGDDYVALYIKKSSVAPKLIHIASFSELSAIHRDLIYTTPELYNIVWKALESAIDDVQNIYFSAAGMFYNTAIEYLPDEDGISFYQKKNVYRLSSTKELYLTKSRSIKKSAMFGGINYDTKPSIMIKQSQAIDTTNDIRSTIPVDSLDFRGAATSAGFAYLEGTMDEIGEIALIALESGIENDVFSGDDGSEANFKLLSDKEINSLHIATHGFYYAGKSINNVKNIEQIFYESNTHFTPNGFDVADEDKMLTRSGLVFAGANNVIKKVPLPEGTQDGILHADEIANMNLYEVDLLVLSACQSGLGQIVSSEGVFGLQRGFKKAGVNSIVMSLWRVNDAATHLLMTEMYKNLAIGQTKREALSNAQNILRSAEGGLFDKPEYWAAFVIIDALN